MNGTFQAQKPEDHVYTLNYTMTLKEWEEFKDQLSDKWPSWKFSEQIHSMVSEAHRTYWPND